MKTELLNPVSAIVIPSGQALISGLAGGVLAGSIAGLAGADIWSWAGLVGALVFCLTWVNYLVWWRNAIVPRLQESPAYYPATETVRVELAQEEGRWVDWLNLPMGLETVTRAARDLVSSGYNTSNLGGAGRSLTRAQSETLRDWLILHELAAWRRPEAHTSGWDLTPAGRALMRRLVAIDQDPPTPPAPELPKGWAYRRTMQTHTDTQTEAGQ